MIERKRITCPETVQLEEVELDRTPIGLIVIGCSREPDGALACSRECTRRLDRGDRADADDRERVLVIVASLHDDAARAASALASCLADDGLCVELAQLAGRPLPPLEDYDAVVIGARVRLGRHARATIAYIREHRDQLAAMPAFFYSIGDSASDRARHIQRMTQRTGWHPTQAIAFADSSAIQPAIAAFAQQVSDAIPAVSQPA